MLRVNWESSLSTAEWADLSRVIPSRLRFMTDGWWEAWSRAMLPYQNWHGPMRYAVVRIESDQVVGVLPCAWQQFARVNVLSLGGYYQPLRSILLDKSGEREITEALVQFLSSDRSVMAFRMGPIEMDKSEAISLKTTFEENGWSLYRLKRSTTFVAELPPTIDEFKERVSRKKFKRLQYYRNRLSKRGEVRIEKYSGLDQAGWAVVLSELATVESASWVGTSGGNTRYADPKSRRFWGCLTASKANSDAMCAWVLYLDDSPVSFATAIDSEECRYMIANAYDPVVKDFSTGSILYGEIFSDSFESQKKVVHIGEGDSGYKSTWGVNVTPAFEDWIAFRPGPLGTAMRGTFQVARRVQDLISKAQAPRLL